MLTNQTLWRIGKFLRTREKPAIYIILVEMYNVLALHSCSELREEKDEENSGTPESARERRLTYSVSPVPPSEPPHLHDNLPPPPPPTDDVVAVPTSGSRKRRLTHSTSPSSSLLQSGLSSELSPLHDDTSPPTDDMVAVTTSGSRERRLTHSVSPSSSLLRSGPPPELSPLHGNTSPPTNDVVAMQTSGSRERRLTHSISPSSSLLQSGTVSVAMTTSSTPEREMDTAEKSVITNKFCVTILAFFSFFAIYFFVSCTCTCVSLYLLLFLLIIILAQ